MQYIGKIIENSGINFGKYGLQTEHLLNGESDVTYEEMELLMNVNPSTQLQVLSINLKQEITSSKQIDLVYMYHSSVKIRLGCHKYRI